MNYIRIFIIALFLPTIIFSAEKAKPLNNQVETPAAQATEEATKESKEVTVNGAGISFIVLAIGGILIATLQGGGSIAH